ncbi:MAG: Dabb family protein [Bacteroidota bacterium]
MIKHIVMFRLKSDYAGTGRTARLASLKKSLDALPEKIREIKEFETGLNISKSPSAYDLVLISAFENSDDLDVYRKHPEHQAVVKEINEIMDVITVVDYKK